MLLRLACVAIVIALCTATLHAGPPSEAANAAMTDLNASFIEAHAVANSLDLKNGGPIILLRDGQLVLIHEGKETAVDFFPPEFDTFKVFAHLPVAIYLMLGPPGEGEIDAARLEALAKYRAKLEGVAKDIDGIGLNGLELERQQKIVAASAAFLDGIIKQKKISQDELLGFTRRMTPMIKANIAGAAKAQLEGMHKQVMAWKAELPPSAWRKLRVAVKGAVLAREGNLALQYFTRLLGPDETKTRLVFMESYYPPTPMETLLATRSVDRGIAIAIFDEPDRMFRDVLADAAAAYIKQLKFE